MGGHIEQCLSALLYLFIQYVCIEHLLISRCCSGRWGHTILNIKEKGIIQLAFCRLTDNKGIKTDMLWC